MTKFFSKIKRRNSRRKHKSRKYKSGGGKKLTAEQEIQLKAQNEGEKKGIEILNINGNLEEAINKGKHRAHELGAEEKALFILSKKLTNKQQEIAKKKGEIGGNSVLYSSGNIDEALEVGKSIAHDFGANDRTLAEVEKTINLPVGQTVYYLIGPPAIGKSSYLNSIINMEFPDISVLAKQKEQKDNEYINLDDRQPLLIINRDNIVERIGEIQNPPLSYSDMFDESNEKKSQLDKIVNKAFRTEIDKIKQEINGLPKYSVVIIDMTNMTKRSRVLQSKGNSKIQKNYKIKKIGIKFNWDIPNNKKIIFRLAELRNEKIKKSNPEQDKVIPYKAIERMIDNYNEIDEDEEFDQIINVDTLPSILKLLE